MDYITRDIEKVVLRAADSFGAVLVTGPRQVGKTTTLRHIADIERRYVTLDDYTARSLAQNDPEQFFSLYPPPVLIDEIQYAPQLFSWIKIAIDNHIAPGAFWMTGSQTFRHMELAQESLAGRVAILTMTALSQHEIYGSGEHSPLEIDLPNLQSRVATGKHANLHGMYERIWRGAMPGHLSGRYPDRELFYSSYLQTYIQRDITDMSARIDTLLFADFIRAAACRSGQMLNVHAIAGDIGVSDDTARRWLLLLERSGVIFFLRPYATNLLKRAIKTPKMYFFDTGLVAYLTRHSSSELLMYGAINGAILENYVVAELIKSYLNAGKEPLLYYYRDKDNREIDIIMENNGKLHPIEIKRAASPTRRSAKTFRVLNNAPVPVGTGAVICIRDDLSAIDRDTLLVPVWIV